MKLVWVLGAAGAAMACAVAPARAQDSEGDPAGAPITAPQPVVLPDAVRSPLDIDFSADPVLGLATQTADRESFRAILAAALAESPVDREAAALERAAGARVQEAIAVLRPTLDVNLGSYRTLARNFSNDPGNILERSRPRQRTDATAQLQVPVFAFGGFEATYEAAQARQRAASLSRDDRVNQVAIETVFAWSEVFAYQSLVRLYEGFVAAQDGLRSGIESRIAQGVSAESDLAQVASLRAQGEVQLAQARRRLAAAETQFTELAGFAPPARLRRLPRLDEGGISREYAILAAEAGPGVRSAEELAQAKRLDAKVTRSQEFPRISAGADLGRYGVLEDREDYDLRATVNVRYRIFGGGLRARTNAALADADAAVASADRTREEAARDAATAWSDVNALEEQLRALDAAYRAARQSRDVIVTRFGALRGSLFDVADAQNVYLRAAGAYIQALTELDTARYLLLARTDRLLDIVGIAQAEDRR